MPYTGHVHPGGPADVHELAQLVISKVSVGPMDNNAYLLRCRHRRAAAGGRRQRGRPAARADRRRRRGAGSSPPTSTADHWQALAGGRRPTGARTFAHPEDAPGSRCQTDVFLRDGDRCRFGDVALAVIHLVGHTPGSIALLYDDPDGRARTCSPATACSPGARETPRGTQRFASLMAG